MSCEVDVVSLSLTNVVTPGPGFKLYLELRVRPRLITPPFTASERRRL